MLVQSSPYVGAAGIAGSGACASAEGTLCVTRARAVPQVAWERQASAEGLLGCRPAEGTHSWFDRLP
ncbi:hypothetical protein [Streptomyces sp. NRRL S-337]|uniref:hypothetical protein n=1 Tax=Streptomyces sp. NRRL S-337 TaxID=1463900 RepID=UPI0004C6E9E2|nr:hypothetical protein [Streptomyces sp. NRRL S-337]